MLCRWYTKTDSPLVDKSAVVLYLHGGGYILGNVPLFDGVCGDYVLHTGVPFFSAEYRLAPEFPYPVPLKDAYEAFLWLHSHAIGLGIDTDRIAVMGDSAGGGLAAALTHYILEKQGPRLAKQILIYPMLDDRNTIMDKRIAPFATWNGHDNETGWDCLLGPLRGTPGVPPSAAPARMTDPRGLPDLFMDVAELDHFRCEDIAYAAMFAKANMSVEIHVRPGCPHGWELIAPKAKITSRAMEDRWHAIQTIGNIAKRAAL